MDSAHNVGRVDPFRVVEARHITLTPEDIETMYGHVRGIMGEHFEEMSTFLRSRPLLAVRLEGDDAVTRLRAILGPTDSKKAPLGTIRNLFGDGRPFAPMYRNAAHSSDSAERALGRL